MSDVATRDLATLEGIIERGMATFVDVGTALAEIRDGKKYHDGGYNDFDTYCRDRWGFNRQRAYQMIEAATITTELSKILDTPLPIRDSQARELGRIEPEHRAETWQAVIAEHGPKPTAQNVRSVVEARRWAPVDFAPTPEPIEMAVSGDDDRMVARVLDTDDMRVARLRLQYVRESKHLHELIQLKPDAVAAVLERDEMPLVRMQIADTRRWLDELEHAIQPRGLRVIG